MGMIQRFEEVKQQLIGQGYDEENIRVRTALLFFANPYYIAEGGQTNEGISVSYTFSKNLNPVHSPNTKALGIRVGKTSFTPEKLAFIPAAPAVYEFLCVDQVNANGQMVAKPVDLAFKSYIGIKLEPDFPFKETVSEPGKAPVQEKIPAGKH